jgi:hypothetical protein
MSLMIWPGFDDKGDSLFLPQLVALANFKVSISTAVSIACSGK